ncbi:hypothetical protein ODJ79_38470 [Actinoplanes sp. KI2]|uniref:Eco57I restriction-modification methylase domain-containing protein n=1 Tax=Actinoplanes sp. KI2 TaxID=2983315 RepID=UPI0021D5D280|nr:type IIL restriction-modification enzyme MmeI [Actinoplanes sp. KI2]MCU7729636.1 hypothetical protein [Actinoplanes sp. KI2]
MRGNYLHHSTAGDYDHKRWLSLIEVSGPFLSVPVLRQTWPTLDALDKPDRERLRTRHADWQIDQTAGQTDWLDYVLGDLLGWGDALHRTGLDGLAVTVAEHDTVLTPDFALVQPGEEIKPDTVRLLGVICPAGSRPTARVKDSTWAATPADRLAQMCRHHDIELGLATEGRFWTLVWAPRGGATTMATFDTIAWPEAAERDVVRAFRSLLHRRRFCAVPDDEKLAPLLRKSLDNQEEITEALGVQVRQAVELLVGAFGRIDVRDRELGERGLQDVDAHEVYRGAVSVMMRIVFLLFAEERQLLPADNELYATAYSAGRLCAELEQRVTEGTEEDLEHSTAAWQRLIGLFNAVYHGVDHPRLTMHGHDGSLFDPAGMPWLPLNVDDRTVLHMLRAVQFVQIGRGAKTSERRTVSFRTLDVEQIGYVYEGLLSFEGFRAEDVTVGLIGREGLEDEVRLTELEDLAARHPDSSELAKVIAEKYKDSRIGSSAAVAKRLISLEGIEREEARKKLLAVTGGDYELSKRLLPFYGLIRNDLRDLPVVVLPGALFVTESALRRNTGTHYTPRKLAEEIVEGALEPLVYEPGPLQTANTMQWKPKSSEQILALKVADIAMGSAAFLVAAARYLGRHLLDAALREGKEWARTYRAPAETSALDLDDDPAVIEARRQIIEHCLYGVDINPMAVEMAKLSLWLVSMDPQRPFTFLDDRLVSGDSLLGLGNIGALPTDAVRDFRLDRALSEAKQLRHQITELPDTAEAQHEKKRLLHEARSAMERARDYADLVAGSWVASTTKGEDARRVAARTAETVKRFIETNDAEPVRQQARTWLAVDLPAGGFARRPLHWPLEFPEVFDRGGFDAIIGNPPFLGGQKIARALGDAYRELLVQIIGREVRGSADLVAYFLLRTLGISDKFGQVGLLATNTLAQGDTRAVGLEQITRSGAAIRKAVRSRPWPSSVVALQYCAVWITREPLGSDALRILDGVPVDYISAHLEPARIDRFSPMPLSQNNGIAFKGAEPGDMGFVVEAADAKLLIDQDRRNLDVLYPYINGKELNSNYMAAADRWIVDFGNRSLDEAKQYAACFATVESQVKPERRRGHGRMRSGRWWSFARGGAQDMLSGLRSVVVMAQVSRTAIPVRVDPRQVFDQKIIVFAVEDLAFLAFLNSSQHYLWAASQSGTMKADLSYSPTDALLTLPLPSLSDELRRYGEDLDGYRREVMRARRTGVTATYNLAFNAACMDDDIVELRRLHRAIDEAVCRAYGWDDLVQRGLDHGFHRVGAYIRFTVSPSVQREILDRLLELNHARYAEEVAKGLHDKKGGRPKGGTQASLFEGMGG